MKWAHPDVGVLVLGLVLFVIATCNPVLSFIGWLIGRRGK